MTIIPLQCKIQRASNGKKEYIGLEANSIPSMKPSMPKDWQTIKGSKALTPSYAIRADLDLVVIDCDSLDTTQEIDNILVPSVHSEHYIVVSDKGEKHFYFKPSKYYQSSPVYKTTRLSLGKIDILHGTSLIFAPCALNTTKHILQGSIDNLTEIPDNIVDHLISLLKETVTSSDNTDYSPLTSYLAPTIEASLALYARSRDYRDIQNVIQLITPAQFKHEVKPDYHPDRIPDGEGITYLQAITAKIGRDPSISLELHEELLTVITQDLWSDPLPLSLLRAHIDSIPGQTYSTSGKPVFMYDPQATNKPLVAINNNPYMPLYRTLDDTYILAKPTGSVEQVKGLSNLKKALMSRNYSLRVDNQEVKIESRISKIADILETVTVSHHPYQPHGVYEEDGSLYYNTYAPTKYLSIIRGEYLQEAKYRYNSTPVIDQLLYNLVADHPPESRMVHKLEQFISYKLKTLQYSPIVLQFMGNRGTGKGTFIDLLNIITASTSRVKLNTSNSQFNADTAGKMFVNEDEGTVTAQLVNALKELSGNKLTRIEAKGKDAIMARNVATYICTTNKPSQLAEVVDDRRFVSLYSFTASQLQIPNLETMIALEVEQWCLKLRDTKIENKALYVDANQWHDKLHTDAFEAKGETTQHVPTKLASLLYNVNNIDGDSLKKELEAMLGVGFHYTIARNGLRVYLYKSRQHERLSDKANTTHEITKADLEKVGLGSYITEDTNNKVYNKRIFFLLFDLSIEQRKSFCDVETVEPIEC